MPKIFTLSSMPTRKILYFVLSTMSGPENLQKFDFHMNFMLAIVAFYDNFNFETFDFVKSSLFFVDSAFRDLKI